MAVWDRIQFKSAARRGCDADALHEFELLIGASLPGDYRDFLLAVNGGAPESGTLYALAPVDWQNKPAADSGGDAILQYLYVLDNWKGIFEGERNEALTLEWAYRVRVPEQRVLPPGMIPIGCDPSGGQFVLDVEGKQPSESRAGSVWFWASDYHDRHRAAAEPFHSLGFIAVSFSDFLAKIRFEDL